MNTQGSLIIPAYWLTTLLYNVAWRIADHKSGVFRIIHNSLKYDENPAMVVYSVSQPYPVSTGNNASLLCFSNCLIAKSIKLLKGLITIICQLKIIDPAKTDKALTVMIA